MVRSQSRAAASTSRLSQMRVDQLPSAAGRRRWLRMPMVWLESRESMESRSCGGTRWTSRSIVSAIFGLCRVLKTKCPVSAAWRAIRAVVASRISPTKMMSGAWRMARRRPVSKDGVSIPTSRWVKKLVRSVKTNSTGSSMVTMWVDRVELMYSRQQAMVVLFPQPVGPVTRIRPERRLSQLVRISSGSPRVSMVGIWVRIWRSTAPRRPRCLWRLTRKRGPSVICQAASTSESLSGSAPHSFQNSVRSPRLTGRPMDSCMTPPTLNRAGASSARNKSDAPLCRATVVSSTIWERGMAFGYPCRFPGEVTSPDSACGEGINRIERRVSRAAPPPRAFFL